MSKSELQDKFVAAEEWFRTMTVKLNEAVNRLSELADQTRESSAGETARAYVQVKNIDGALTDALKALGSVKSRMQYTIVPEKFEQEGCSTYTTDDGFRISLSTLLRASIKDKEAGFKWLRDNELGDLITETVNASTLSAAARSMMESGKELPDEMFTVAVVTNTSVTRTKSRA